MIVVSDASPLIDLLDSGCVSVLNELCEEVIIPEEVHREVFSRPHRAKPRWIRIHSVDTITMLESFKQLRLAVDDGEAAAITVAAELGLPIIIDDKAGVIQCEMKKIEYYSLYRFLKDHLPEKRFKQISRAVRDGTGKMLLEPEF